MGALGPDPKETQYIDPEEFHSRSFKESLSYAWEGLVYVYSNERNMRIHVLMGSIVISACFVCGMGRVEFFHGGPCNFRRSYCRNIEHPY